MLKYLVILLDDTSVSFCHYHNDKTERRLIAYDDLKAALLWSMKENLMVQFVYPDYKLPKDYIQLIDTIDHIDIVENDSNADITVINGIDNLTAKYQDVPVVVRIDSAEFFDNLDKLSMFSALTIIFNDIQNWDKTTLALYGKALDELSGKAFERISIGKPSRINIVTDRMQLNAMNNCGAGNETIALAPDGKFYICPAFYLTGKDSVGDIHNGLNIPNAQLYSLKYAPICRICDAYNCKRCIWLNCEMTHEVNTPGQEQCIMAHLERNTSRQLLKRLKTNGIVKSANPIPEIDYLDPFEKLTI